MNLGKEKLSWGQDIWNDINRAVHHEVQRVAIASKFLPLYGPIPKALTIPSEPIAVDGQDQFSIEEAAVNRLVEVWSEFSLTPQQVEDEMQLMTARTLAIRATNFVIRARDALIFRGDAAVAADALFVDGEVRYRSGPAGPGFIHSIDPEQDAEQIIAIDAEVTGQPRFGERTFEAVTKGYARLQDIGHYGPYVLVLHTIPYGDTHGPQPNTLILPADRIQPLVTAGFYGTGALPDLTGVLLSLGGKYHGFGCG